MDGPGNDRSSPSLIATSNADVNIAVDPYKERTNEWTVCSNARKLQAIEVACTQVVRCGTQ